MLLVDGCLLRKRLFDNYCKKLLQSPRQMAAASDEIGVTIRRRSHRTGGYCKIVKELVKQKMTNKQFFKTES